MPPISPSVLVIRLDAIGDALALTPLLAALRERQIPVDLVLRDVNAEAFSARAVRSRFVAPFALRDETRANRAAIARFAHKLAPNAYTHVLVATEDAAGYRLARAIGARRRIGFANSWGKPLKAIWTRTKLTETIVRTAGLDRSAPHECEVLWSLGRGLLEGAPPRDPDVLRPLVLDEDVPRGERILVQITDKWERLGIAFDEVVRVLHLAARVGSVRAVSSAGEAAYAQRVAAASGVEVEYFASLPPWKNAIASAAALVAPDGGALHVAGMVGTPVVALFPPQRNLDLQMARWSPWAAAYAALAADGDWPAAVERALLGLTERVPRL
jgi:ADP-heptose:LPS heptosyltransferase